MIPPHGANGMANSEDPDKTAQFSQFPHSLLSILNEFYCMYMVTLKFENFVKSPAITFG